VRTRGAPPRERLVAAAIRRLEERGPESLQARALTADIGASTQAIYTCFGGMPGLLEAVVAEGFSGLTDAVLAVPASDDPVADFFAQGWAYTDWARAHPQLYRLMFGAGGTPVQLRSGISMQPGGRLATSAEGLAAAEVMVGSLARVVAAGRIDPVDPIVAAAQHLSATHGFILLALAGAFGDPDEALLVAGAMAVNLMVGLGDDRAAAERSLAAAAAART
jgi:AcrR family transcriptional regulator